MLKKLSKVPTEKTLWNNIRPRFNSGYERAYRIETANVPGFPDVIWFPYLRAAVLIELKTGPFRFQRSQIKFISDMHRNGTNVWIVWQKRLGDPIMVWRGEWLTHNTGTTPVSNAEYLEDWMARMKGY